MSKVKEIEKETPPKVEESNAGDLKHTIEKLKVTAVKLSQMMPIEDIKYKEDYKKIIPRPTATERTALETDIYQNGIQQPLTLNKEGVLLEGYTRYDIAAKLGHKNVPFETLNFPNKTAEEEFIIRTNMHRRHLNAAQKGLVATKLLDVEQKLAKIRRDSNLKQSTDKGSKPLTKKGRATEILAARMGIGEKTVIRSNKINKIMNKLQKEENLTKLKATYNDALEGKVTLDKLYHLARQFEDIEDGVEEKKPEAPKPKILSFQLCKENVKDKKIVYNKGCPFCGKPITVELTDIDWWLCEGILYSLQRIQVDIEEAVNERYFPSRWI